MTNVTQFQPAPVVSIIVAVYNGAQVIEKTLTNIISQEYPHKEIIVIDGKSSDQTWDIVQKFSDHIAYSISEKDKGIPDAYNKGISAAKGDWIFFLNADDIFANDQVLSTIFSSQAHDNNIEVLAGSVLSTDGRLFNGRFNWKLLIKNTVHHQAIFYRSKFLRLNRYNTSYRSYGQDHEHNLLIWKHRIRVKYLDCVVANWARGGISDIASWKNYTEEFRVRKNAFGLLGYPFNIFTFLRFFLKRTLFKIFRPYAE